MYIYKYLNVIVKVSLRLTGVIQRHKSVGFDQSCNFAKRESLDKVKYFSCLLQFFS